MRQLVYNGIYIFGRRKTKRGVARERKSKTETKTEQ